MRVLHITTSISRQGGGPSRSTQGLVSGLRAAGVDAWLMTLSHGEEPWIKGVDQFVNGGDFDQAMLDIKPDIVHIHGIWSPALHRCAVFCRRWGVPYVIAPRGMLEPWSLKAKWLKKRIARFLYQDRDLKRAAALHATAASEEAQFRKLGLKNPMIVSPNGVNVPESVCSRAVSNSVKRALFVSRMHPKKGVLELVESWGHVRPDGWVCELVYTLNGETEMAYEAKVKEKVAELGLSDKFIFTGPLDDEMKWKAYARADLFVLPTYSENFGIVIAEALWAGVPVITTKGAPWEEIGTRDCGWWIETGVEALVETLRTAFATPTSSLAGKGARGHALIEERYTWKAVVGAMKHGYEQILNPCEHAPCDTCRNYGDMCSIR